MILDPGFAETCCMPHHQSRIQHAVLQGRCQKREKMHPPKRRWEFAPAQTCPEPCWNLSQVSSPLPSLVLEPAHKKSSRQLSGSLPAFSSQHSTPPVRIFHSLETLSFPASLQTTPYINCAWKFLQPALRESSYPAFFRIVSLRVLALTNAQ